MNVAIGEAKAQLANRVGRAEAGEEVVLTRRARPVARLETVKRVTPEKRRTAIDRALEMARKPRLPGPDAARAADFLRDAEGLPKAARTSSSSTTRRSSPS